MTVSIRYKVQGKVDGKWVDLYKNPEQVGFAFDTKEDAKWWIRWAYSEGDTGNYRVVALISRNKITADTMDKVIGWVCAIGIVLVVVYGW